MAVASTPANGASVCIRSWMAARPPSQRLLADMLAGQSGDSKGRGIGFAAGGDRRRQRDEDQYREDVAGQKGERDAQAILEQLAPFESGVRHHGVPSTLAMTASIVITLTIAVRAPRPNASRQPILLSA